MINIAALTFAFILSGVAIFYPYKRKKKSSKHTLLNAKVLEELNYSVSKQKAEQYVLAYLNDNFDRKLGEPLAFYLLTLLGQHYYSSLSREYLYKLACKVRFDYHFMLSPDEVKSCKLIHPIQRGIPQVYMFSSAYDCVYESEWKQLYNLLVTSQKTLEDSFSYTDICKLIDFVLSSRFCGNYHHQSLIDRNTKAKLLVMYIHYANTILKDKDKSKYFDCYYDSSNDWKIFRGRRDFYLKKLQKYLKYNKDAFNYVVYHNSNKVLTLQPLDIAN